ncbi:MAG: tetratricopeptide repeat protein [Vicinamibacteria bacterium]
MPDPIPRGPFDQGLFLAHFNKGRELFEAKRYDDAERELEEAYLLRPRDPRVLNLLGLVYFRAEKLDKAEEVYRKLIAESPDAHTLHYNLGLICFKLGRMEDAESAFLKALELTQGNPKIHFYLGSIYERLQRYKDAIYQYRQAGANIMVQRLQGRLQPGAQAPTDGTADQTAPPGRVAPPPRPIVPDTAPPAALPLSLTGAPKSVRPVSRVLLADDTLSGSVTTERFRVEPPAAGRRPLSTPGAETPALGVPPAVLPPASVPSPTTDVFRGLERGLMEVDFSGKVFIKQGTIYSYSGNLTFWVKEKRPGGRPALVIVTGTGRLILTDKDREITFMQVADEAVFVEPMHLLACEEALQPRYVRFGEEADPVEVIALEGRGMVALSVASKPLPLTVRPDQPVSVPASSVIMWTGSLMPHVVEDPEVYAVVAAAPGGGRLVRLEGTGRILVEQARAGQI